ncbi:ATP synthase F1 subunit epsilon [Candidatus Parcubacteria bacterium]|nr:MAG: ATP synthase F1 subunit epsilon [Candidatus Parcubacteria bacterium]
MSDTKIQFQIATPEKIVFSDKVDEVIVDTKMGQITILPHHLPLVASLVPGELLLKKGAESFPIAISGGFIEVQKNNKVVILADTAERFEEIDEKRAEEALQNARRLMSEKRAESVDYTALAAKLEKELSRLKVKRKYRGHHGNILGEQ